MKIVITLDVPISDIADIDEDYRNRTTFVDIFKIALLNFTRALIQGTKVDSVIVGVNQINVEDVQLESTSTDIEKT